MTEQAALLRSKCRELEALGVDWANVAEELDTLGRTEKRELRSRLEISLVHWSLRTTLQVGQVFSIALATNCSA
jgi:hypothetical protein